MKFRLPARARHRSKKPHPLLLPTQKSCRDRSDPQHLTPQQRPRPLRLLGSPCRLTGWSAYEDLFARYSPYRAKIVWICAADGTMLACLKICPNVVVPAPNAPPPPHSRSLLLPGGRRAAPNFHASANRPIMRLDAARRLQNGSLATV